MTENLDAFKGIIPAFYACYDKNGEVDTEAVKELTSYFIRKEVKGIYVCGSSGECIYQSVEDRKKTLEAVMSVARGKLTVIVHVACNNTKDSRELAAHAESLGVDAIASIPPIYFHLPAYSISDYWNDISSAAPNTPFIIYNIPQLAGTALSEALLEKMLENPRVIGVKNSSMPVQDIQVFKAAGDRKRDPFIVFNGPDEQLVSGLTIGAEAGIGGTYGAMPELFLKIYDCVFHDDISKAREIQYAVNSIICKLCSGYGNMYAMIKEVLRIREGLDIGGVRKPLTDINENDRILAKEASEMIDEAITKYCWED
ncbi:MAG: dihydrodipicolinate synthase family protein [Lachnospiraceae bacterium]|jgi:N-acetylneuraminate lyase|nr:dihydrodipicolinate synthase family protein [Lachnospiraceae bacterium]MCI1727672.1 dihydrodipicolinate synthase family protein [Lachnospiraceae bacterium]